jgi:hypothetical protein
MTKCRSKTRHGNLDNIEAKIRKYSVGLLPTTEFGCTYASDKTKDMFRRVLKTIVPD